jgi:hypothetical protein
MNSTEPIAWQLSGPGTLSTTLGATTVYTPPASGTFAVQAVVQATTPSGLLAQATVSVGLTPALTVSPTMASATIGGGAVTLSATAMHFPQPPPLTWTLLGAGSLSATTGAVVQWTPPASGLAGMSMVTVSAPGGFTALATLSYSSAPSLILNRTTALAMATFGGRSSVALTATLSGSTAPITWTLTGPGALTTGTGATTQYGPPTSLNDPMGFTDVVVTASAGALTATCTIRLYRVDLEMPEVFVSDAPVMVSARPRGVSVTGAWRLSGPGQLVNSTGLSTQYVPSHDPAAVGTGRVTFATTEGDASRTFTLERRRSRGLTVVAWGTVPAIVTSGGTTLSVASSFVSTGANSAIRATRATTGVTSVQVDGLALGARSSAVEVTGWAGARCTVDSATLDTFVVRCVNASNALTNSPFSFRVVQDRLASGGVLLATGIVPSMPPGPTATPLTPENALSALGPITLSNASQGAYTLALGAIPPGVTVGAVLLTPLAPRSQDQRCSVSAVVQGDVTVACTDLNGTPTNQSFAFAIMGKGVVSEASIDALLSVATAPTAFGPVASAVSASAGISPPLIDRTSVGGFFIYGATDTDVAGQAGLLVRGRAPATTLVSARSAGTTCVSATVVPGFFVPVRALVTCYGSTGLVDTGIDLTVTSRGRPSVANVTGFASVNGALATETLTTSPTAYSASGGAITSTKRGVGSYRVTFANLALTNATAMVTANGSAHRCAVESVLGDDVDVRCYSPTNQPADVNAFFVTVHEYAAPSTARVMSWVRVPASGAAPAPPFVSNPAGAVTVSRTAAGTYSVTFTGLGVADLPNLEVAAQNSSRFCSISSWSPPGVGVQCFDGSALADSDFTLVGFANQPFTTLTQPVTTSEVLAFAFASDPTSASYTPFVPLTYNSAAQPVTATRTGAGLYAMRFPGLSFNSGVVQVTPTDTANRCAVLSQLDDTVQVRCYGPSGLPADSRYLLSFVR